MNRKRLRFEIEETDARIADMVAANQLPEGCDWRFHGDHVIIVHKDFQPMILKIDGTIEVITL